MTGALWIMLLAQAAPTPTPAQTLDLSDGPVSTTTVAVTVTLDPQGRVVSCKPSTGAAGPAACAGFKKGRVVSAPLRKNGKPIGGLMTVSTTSIVSER